MFVCKRRIQSNLKNWKLHHLTDGNSQSSEACGFLIEVRHIIFYIEAVVSTCSGSEREAGTNFGGVQERRGGIAGCFFLLRKWMDLDLWKIKQRNRRSWSHFWLKKAVQWTTKKMEFQLYTTLRCFNCSYTNLRSSIWNHIGDCPNLQFVGKSCLTAWPQAVNRFLVTSLLPLSQWY